MFGLVGLCSFYDFDDILFQVEGVVEAFVINFLAVYLFFGLLNVFLP